MRQAVLPRLLPGGLPALPAGELSRERQRAKGVPGGGLYAALDRTGVAFASTPDLTTPWVRPVAIS